MSYKEDITVLDTDFSADVNESYNKAKQQLQQVRTENLEGPDRALPGDLNNELDSNFTSFTQAKPQKLAELVPKRDEAKKKHVIFLCVKIAMIVVGVICIFGGGSIGGFGWVLLAAGIVCHFVFRSIDDKAAASVAGEWRSFFGKYLALFGQEETLHESASGLYAKVDELYLKSLDAQARGFEIQNRQMKKQMEAQNEQHQEALAMQRAQMKQMQAGLNAIADEQRRGNFINSLRG